MARAIPFPPEITALIVKHLVNDNYPNRDNFTYMSNRGEATEHSLAPYASVSREWQNQIERHTFALVHLDSGRLPAARQYLTANNRWKLVRAVFFRVDLPEYDAAACERVESPDEQRLNNETFTKAVQAVFSLFCLVQTQQGMREVRNGPGIIFGIDAACESDDRYKGDDHYIGYALIRHQMLRRQGLTNDITDARYQSSYLELVLEDDQQLPSIYWISEFRVPHGARKIAPAACCEIAASLVELDTLWLELPDQEKKNLELRRRLRHGMFDIICLVIRHMHLQHVFLKKISQNLSPSYLILSEMPALIPTTKDLLTIPIHPPMSFPQTPLSIL